MKVVMMILCLSFVGSAFAEQVETECLAMSESREVAAKTDPSIKPQEAKTSGAIVR